MAKKKQAAAPKAPAPSKAAKEKDAEEKPTVYRVDLGEAIPTHPLKTATDKK